MMFQIKVTGKTYKQLKAITRETGKKAHEVLEELVCGSPEEGIDEFNQDEPVEDPIDEPTADEVPDETIHVEDPIDEVPVVEPKTPQKSGKK